jgi:hypothetical protein
MEYIDKGTEIAFPSRMLVPTRKNRSSVSLAHDHQPLYRRNELYLVTGFFLVLAACHLYPFITDSGRKTLSFCLFHRVTGLPCLLCGMTRSFVATFHLQFSDALRYHFLGPPFFFGLSISSCIAFFLLLSRRRLVIELSTKMKRAISYSLLLALVASWIGKLIIFGVNV